MHAKAKEGRNQGREIDARRSVLNPPGGKFTSFIPLNAPLDQVLMQIKDEGSLTFLGKLKSDPETSIVVSTVTTVTILRIATI